jgi:hypothetical protein
MNIVYGLKNVSLLQSKSGIWNEASSKHELQWFRLQSVSSEACEVQLGSFEQNWRVQQDAFIENFDRKSVNSLFQIQQSEFCWDKHSKIESELFTDRLRGRCERDHKIPKIRALSRYSEWSYGRKRIVRQELHDVFQNTTLTKPLSQMIV